MIIKVESLNADFVTEIYDRAKTNIVYVALTWTNKR